ncbi:hypothetical protein CNE01570 [Cryptococcus gattii WM276]|uniref:DH domain-containing protein n=1 Tax=Cryptococcus gattii serotype B (strain WM276 / ATCC MYA-4071) TaxID=367775 RepID=E6R6Q7_CRYGW|nr:uncharacterized protein CGB_E2090C [Cryptococcus gattii WM276]ADV22470.1 hypothetical protein CNE01570 [Cryptococcus gattii WM276]KJE04932.1 hypothetical protein I311_01382 [Cryptococcus gattii NT-10]
MRLGKRRSKASLQDTSQLDSWVTGQSSPSILSTQSKAAAESSASFSDATFYSPSSTRASSPVEKRNVFGKKKRDKTGENKYPPSSFSPGHGWNFGRMRSFKGRNEESSREVTSESEPEADVNLRCPCSSSDLAESTSSGSPLPPRRQPVSRATFPSDIPYSVSVFQTPSTLYSSDTDELQSADSSRSVKRRSASMIYDQQASRKSQDVDMGKPSQSGSPSISSATYSKPSSPTPALSSGVHTEGIPSVPPFPSQLPHAHNASLPEGAAPANQYYFSSLNRNPSTATSHASTSSAACPSTEESAQSALLTTPSDPPGRELPNDHIWSRMSVELTKIPLESEEVLLGSTSLVGQQVIEDQGIVQDETKVLLDSPTSKAGSSKTATTDKSSRALRIKTSNFDLVSVSHRGMRSSETPIRRDVLRSPVEGFTPINRDGSPENHSSFPCMRDNTRDWHNASLSAPSVASISAYRVGEVGAATCAVVSRAQEAPFPAPRRQSMIQSDGRRRDEIEDKKLRKDLSKSPEKVKHVVDAGPQLVRHPPRKENFENSVKAAAQTPQLYEFPYRPAPPPPHLSKTVSAQFSSTLKHMSLPMNEKRSDPSAFSSRQSLRIATSRGMTLPPLPPEPLSPTKGYEVPMERSRSFGRMLRRLSMGKSPGKKKQTQQPVQESSSGHQTDKDTSNLGLSGVPHLNDTESSDHKPALKEEKGAHRSSLETFRSTCVERNIDDNTALMLSATPLLPRQQLKDVFNSSGIAGRSKSMPPRKRSPPSGSADHILDGSYTTSPQGTAPSSPVSNDVGPSASATTLSSTDSTPKGTLPPSGSLHTWRTLLGPYTPPELLSLPSYFQPPRPYSPSAPSSPRHRSHNFAPDESERHSHEVRRRYRQSLVHIKDDNQFAYMLEEFSRIENDPRTRMALGGGVSIAPSSGRHEKNLSAGEEVGDFDERLIMRGKSKDMLEKKAKQQSIAAWFVTREIVQGESRHAKLLAKGLRVAKAAVASKSKDKEPGTFTPASQFSRTSSNPTSELPELPPAPSRLRSHYRTGSVPSLLRKRRSSFGEHQSQAPLGTTSSMASSPTASQHVDSAFILPATKSQLPARIPTSVALATLLSRLPNLLDLSLNLSSAFLHDASPYGVAQAFLEMEETLIREVGRWAGEVGNVVVSGVTESLNKVMEDERKKRGKGLIDEEGDQSDEKLAYLDIILMPVQRASRYRLLFQGKNLIAGLLLSP